MAIMSQDQPQKENYRIPFAAIVELAEKNLSHVEIAKLLGCSRTNITQRLKDHEITKKFIGFRATALAHLQRKIYDSITDADLKKASLMQKATAFGVFYDKERLERGESTQNIAYADMVLARKLQGDKGQAIQRAIEAKQGHSDADINTRAKCQSEDYQGLAGDL